MQKETAKNDSPGIQISFDQVIRKYTITSNFRGYPDKSLGNGSFSQVFEGEWQDEKVAVKQFTITNETEYPLKYIENEIMVMATVCPTSEHLVKLKGVVKEPYSLVIEYMPKNNLCTLLHNNELTITWPQRYQLALEITLGLRALHLAGWLHRDIKGYNVLLDADGRAKLSDYGLAKLKVNIEKSKDEKQAGTPGAIGGLRWADPQIIKGEEANEATDIYSLGVVFWELATRQIPYEKSNKHMSIGKFPLGKEREEELDLLKETQTPEEFKKLIISCWDVEQSRRPTADTIANSLFNWLMSKNKPDEIKKLDHALITDEYLLTVNDKNEITINPDDHNLTKEQLKILIDKENIIDYIKSSAGESEKLKGLISYGSALCFESKINFLRFVLGKDPEQFKNLVPHISNLSAVEIHQPGDQDDQKETLLHLSIRKIQPTLFIFFILCGGDIKKTSENNTISRCYEDVSKDSKTNEDLKIIKKLIELPLYTSSSSCHFFPGKILSKTEIDEKRIDSLPKKSGVIEYLKNVLLCEIELGNKKDVVARYVLASASCNADLYKTSEILFFILQALIKLEETNDTLTDTEKYLNCLKFLISSISTFGDSPFMLQIKEIYARHSKPATPAGNIKAKFIAKSLVNSIQQKKIDEVKKILRTAQGLFPNPLLLRETGYVMTPFDHIVEAIFKEGWNRDPELISLLKTSVGFFDSRNVYQFFKFNRIECQILYALARKIDSQAIGERGSANRLFAEFCKLQIECHLELIAICRDTDGGFYVMMTKSEYDRVQAIMGASKIRWGGFGKDFMSAFNEKFEITKLVKIWENLHRKENVPQANLEKWVTQLRDCVYDTIVIVRNKKDLVANFELLVKAVPIPKELAWVKEHLRSSISEFYKEFPEIENNDKKHLPTSKIRGFS